MGFKVQVLLDSVNEWGQRYTTFRLEFPTQILKEVNTHTILDKNASSSRAIPVETKLRKLLGGLGIDPTKPPGRYFPIHVGANQKGMQAEQKVTSEQEAKFAELWDSLFENVANTVGVMNALGVHKQEINPLLEAFDWTRQVISGTHWTNFFALRTHKDAKPAFRYLARSMYLSYRKSEPKALKKGEWHRPFIQEQDVDAVVNDLNGNAGISIAKEISAHAVAVQALLAPGNLSKMVWSVDALLNAMSAARCARVSFDLLNERKRSTWRDDMRTFYTLVGNPYILDINTKAPCLREGLPVLRPKELGVDPMHASPLQHVNTPVAGWHANHDGWLSFRRLMRNEHILEFNPDASTVAEWEAEVDPKVFCNNESDWQD